MGREREREDGKEETGKTDRLGREGVGTIPYTS